MSNFNFGNVGSIGHAGDINNYGISESDLRLVQGLAEDLRTIRSSPSISSGKQQELDRALELIDSACATPTKDKMKTTFDRVSPRLRSLLSSIGANITSDVLVAACTHAYKHLDSIQSFLL